MEAREQKKPVGVIGTGNFGRAIAKRLYYSGYDVIIGSRRPEERFLSSIDECFCDIKLVSIDECMKSAHIIFIAIHAENYKDALQSRADWLTGKILIDVSNTDRPSLRNSNAEDLQRLIPGASVVKAFNVISANAMENDYSTSSRQVFVAGADEEPKTIVSRIARDLSFVPLDFGNIQASRKIEAHPLRVFPDFRGPIGFSVAVFNIWLLYLIYIYYIEKTSYTWDQLSVKVFNKAVCMTGITVLSVTYLANSVAIVYQIYHGTKHVQFSRWLHKWMKTRTQLSIVAFTLISIHVIMSILIMSPSYLPSLYRTVSVPKANTSLPETPQINHVMNWTGEAAILAGILAFFALCVVVVTSIPSVGDSMNWREWRVVTSRFGHAALFLAAVHVIMIGAPQWAQHPYATFASITFLSSILPWITLVSKVTFCLPCLYKYVRKLRRGWERTPSKCQGRCANPNRRALDYKRIKSDSASLLPRSGSCPCTEDALPMDLLEERKCSCCAGVSDV